MARVNFGSNIIIRNIKYIKKEEEENNRKYKKQDISSNGKKIKVVITCIRDT